jgi:hypothetical protein
MDSDSEWPRGVVRVQPPWILRGDAFLAVTASPAELNLADGGIASELRGIYNNLFNAVVIADYRESPIGPFRELLYIPGRFRFGLDDERMSITRGYANTEVARLNRRAYWGVRSRLATISRTTGGDNSDVFAIGERPFARFGFETFGPDIALNGHTIPEAFRAFAQLEGDRRLLYTLAITGTMRAARFEPQMLDASMFPDMAKREFLLGLKISNFLAEFPLAHTNNWTTA